MKCLVATLENGLTSLRARALIQGNQTNRRLDVKIFAIAKNALAYMLIAQMALLPIASTQAQAEMLSTDAAMSKYSGYADRDFLMSELQKDEIRNEIIALGVDPAEAEKRLAVLSDDEIATILSQMDEDSAGAGVVSVLVTVIVILMITDLLCVTQIFPFIRCVR
ncbi:MAG: PA2779 family protein [Rhodobacteraceae bacterium]|nr:PA2779 family protein [Paracoccaceae bacterium]